MRRVESLLTGIYSRLGWFRVSDARLSPLFSSQSLGKNNVDGSDKERASACLGRHSDPSPQTAGQKLNNRSFSPSRLSLRRKRTRPSSTHSPKPPICPPCAACTKSPLSSQQARGGRRFSSDSLFQLSSALRPFQASPFPKLPHIPAENE